MNANRQGLRAPRRQGLPASKFCRLARLHPTYNEPMVEPTQDRSSAQAQAQAQGRTQASGRLRTGLLIGGSLITALIIAYAAGPRVRPPALTSGLRGGLPAPEVPASLSELDGWLARSEAGVPALRPELAKGIAWATPLRERTPLSLVYLHGFSASRRESSPLCEDLGRKLGANVFFARLHGHAQDGDALGQVRAEDWYTDALEALAIGERIGEKVVLIGSSTGGTLATWLAARTPGVHALILLSPNFGLKAAGTGLLLRPWGLQLARRVIGTHRTWRPTTMLEGRYWTNSYRVEAVLQMMTTVDVLDHVDLSAVTTPTQIFYTETDALLDVGRIRTRFAELGSPQKQLIAVPGANHVLVGSVLGGAHTAAVAKQILDFLKSLQK